jgi:succinyl-CoA synthetase beta subunit
VTDPLEVLAKEKGLNYVKLDGNIGIIGNGAGLVMSTLDVVAYAGESSPPATAATRGRPTSWTSAVARTPGHGQRPGRHPRGPQVKAYSSTSSAASPRVTQVADGIVKAYEILASHGKSPKPLVVRLDGNNAEKGREILDGAGLPLLERVDTMDGAARRVAELAAAAV